MGGGGGGVTKADALGGLFGGPFIKGLLGDDEDEEMAAPGGPQLKQTPGYSAPMQLFGGMSPEQIAAFNSSKGRYQPGKPPRMPGK